MPSIVENENTCIPLLLIDTAGCDVLELELEDEVSKGNEGEADIVSHHVSNLITSGLSPSQIAVIAPYNLQVDLLRLRLSSKYPTLEIKSVDGFQGREKEAVIISMVRSNDRGEVGFLTEDRRINVAITRARRHLAVICDSQTVGKHPFLKSLIDYFNDNGEVRTAFEYDEVLASSSDVPRPDHLVFKSKTTSSTHKSTKASGTVLKGQRKGQVKKAEVKGQSLSTDPVQRSKEDSTFLNETKRRLLEFKKEPEERLLEFPPLLNSHQRYLVHELAEGYGLYHLSTGEGKERQIVVRKERTEPPQVERTLEERNALVTGNDDSNVSVEELVEDFETENKMELLSDREEEAEEEATEEDGAIAGNVEKSELEQTKEKEREVKSPDTEPASVNLLKCKFCGKRLPPGNRLLHEIHCEKTQAEKKRQNSAGLNKKHRNKAQKQKQKQNLEDASAEDFDTLVAMAMKRDNECNYKRCREKITITGLMCEFCTRRYCFKHHVPEIHGCEEMARHHVRHQMLKTKVVTNGSGVKEKKVDPAHRANLQKKLGAKLGQLGEQRQRKQKPK